MRAVRTVLAVSEPAMIAKPPSCATASTEGRSVSGSPSPLCNPFQGAERVGLDTFAYQVVEQVLPARVGIQPL